MNDYKEKNKTKLRYISEMRYDIIVLSFDDVAIDATNGNAANEIWLTEKTKTNKYSITSKQNYRIVIQNIPGVAAAARADGGGAMNCDDCDGTGALDVVMGALGVVGADAFDFFFDAA